MLPHVCLSDWKLQGKLTFMWAKSIFPIFIKVVSSGAPQEAVISALSCAAVVLSAHKQEGEFTELSISVAKLCFHHCCIKTDVQVELHFQEKLIYSWFTVKDKDALWCNIKTYRLSVTCEEFIENINPKLQNRFKNNENIKYKVMANIIQRNTGSKNV